MKNLIKEKSTKLNPLSEDLPSLLGPQFSEIGEDNF
jgi:hypothetical protein